MCKFIHLETDLEYYLILPIKPDAIPDKNFRRSHSHVGVNPMHLSNNSFIFFNDVTLRFDSGVEQGLRFARIKAKRKKKKFFRPLIKLGLALAKMAFHQMLELEKLSFYLICTTKI